MEQMIQSMKKEKCFEGITEEEQAVRIDGSKEKARIKINSWIDEKYERLKGDQLARLSK